MVIGQYKSKLTDKDRVSVPVKFRHELGEELILARWYENCLVLVSKGNWEKLLRRLTGGSQIVISPVRDIDRFILGSAFEAKLDSQGRFIIPEFLINYAEISHEVVFVGLGDRVEVWSSKKWEDLEQSVKEKAEKAIEKVAVSK